MDMSRHLEEDMLGMDKVELLMVGTVSMNLELNLFGMLELGTVSSRGDAQCRHPFINKIRVDFSAGAVRMTALIYCQSQCSHKKF